MYCSLHDKDNVFLANTQADILVNTTSPDLILTNGTVSKTILERAGSEIQNECATRFPGGIQWGDVAVTQGYNLKCSNVFHGALPEWDTTGNALHVRVARNCHMFIYVYESKCLFSY